MLRRPREHEFGDGGIRMTESSGFVVIYERFDTGRLVLMSLVCLPPAAFALWFVVREIRAAMREWRRGQRLALIGTVFGLVLGAVFFCCILRPTYEEAIIGGVQVEGVVQNYTQTESHGKIDTVRFTVSEVRFEYVHFFGRNAGITRLGDSGRGMLRNGLYVRIEHRNGKILKLEIRE